MNHYQFIFQTHFVYTLSSKYSPLSFSKKYIHIVYNFSWMTNLHLKFSFNVTVHLKIVKNDDCKNKYLDRILVITLRFLLLQHLII